VLFLTLKVGDVTILVNNAAVVHGKSLMDSDDDALLKSQHINTMGQFWVRLSEAVLHAEVLARFDCSTALSTEGIPRLVNHDRYYGGLSGGISKIASQPLKHQTDF